MGSSMFFFFKQKTAYEISACLVGSAKDAIIQMVTKCYQNRECQNLPFDVLRKIIMDSIDIVVHVGRDGVVRHMSDIYYKGAECENF